MTVESNYTLPWWNDARRTANAFKRLASIPCAIPPMILAATALPAICEAGWSIIEPDRKELYHRAFGRSALCTVKGFEREVNLINSTDARRATRFLFTLGEVADLSLWYWFLFGVASKALMNFASAVYTETGCDPNAKPGSVTGGWYVSAIPDTGVWWTIDYSWVPDDVVGPAGPAVVRIPPGRQGTVFGGADFQAFDGKPVPSSARIIDTNTGVIYDTDRTDPNQDDQPLGTKTWTKQHNHGTDDMILLQQFRCDESGLPLGEAFPTHSGSHAFIFQPT